jgi:DNA invertase Pin-like site-specific DNA recombinase
MGTFLSIKLPIVYTAATPWEVGAVDVIIAARLSQKAPGQTGIETQDEDAVAWAQREGHNIVAILPDHKSGAEDWMRRKKLRPYLTEPGKLVQYRAIVAPTQDRLSRGKWRDEVAIRQWAEDHDKEIFIIDSGQQIRWELDASRARDEWEKTSKRYRRMQSWLRDNDFLVGRPPYGHRVVGVKCGEAPCRCKKDEKDHKTLEPDPETAEIVRYMVDKYVSGASQRAIAHWLNVQGIPSPNGSKWTRKTVGLILRGESLIGRRRDASGKVVLRFEPIIEKELWRKLQTTLDANVNRHGPVLLNRGMINGVAFCGKCKHRLHYKDVKKPPNLSGAVYTWRGYRCDGPELETAVCKVMVNADALHGWVNLQMTSPGIGNLPVIEVDVVPGRNYEDDVEEVEDRLRDLDFDDPDFAMKQANLLAERKRLLNMDVEPPRIEEHRTGETVAQRWLRLTEAERRDYLLRAGAKIYVSGRTPADGWRLDVERPNVLSR